MVVYSEIDLKLLQTLLLRAKVIHICIAQVVSLSEETNAIIDDVLTEVVNIRRSPADKRCIKHVVIVFAIVKADQAILDELLDIMGVWVEHLINGLAISREFPADKKQIWKHLSIEKDNGSITIIVEFNFLIF